MLYAIDTMMERYHHLFGRLLHSKSQNLAHLKQLFAKRSMDEKLSLWRNEIAILKRQYETKIELLLREKAQQITFLKEQIDFQTKHNLSKKEQLLSTYTIALSSKEPSRELKECYAQVVKSGKKIALEKIEIGEAFELQTASVILKAKAYEKNVL